MVRVVFACFARVGCGMNGLDLLFPLDRLLSPDVNLPLFVYAVIKFKNR